MNTDEKKAYLDLHIATVFFGLTAILGAKITLTAVILVWWRVIIAGIGMAVLLKLKSAFKKISKCELKTFLFIGFVVALHWIFFYHSIKISNPSIALMCFATTSLFTSLIEPVILKKKFQWLDVLLGLMVIPIFGFVTNNLSDKYFLGVIVGLASALLASIFGILNKKYLKNHDPVLVSFWEMVSAAIIISIYLPFYLHKNINLPFWPSGVSDWFYLLILALGCTTFAYILALRALKVVSAFNANLIISLEPVYGIILAAILLKDYEMLNVDFYIGCTILLLLVLSYPILKRRFYVR
ncbi:MAG TPA: DMT family transporter [Saprospiraceae bacterium]|nr:DMT family transporter [Saprospiraceae bacterium]